MTRRLHAARGVRHEDGGGGRSRQDGGRATGWQTEAADDQSAVRLGQFALVLGRRVFTTVGVFAGRIRAFLMGAEMRSQGDRRAGSRGEQSRQGHEPRQ